MAIGFADDTERIYSLQIKPALKKLRVSPFRIDEIQMIGISGSPAEFVGSNVSVSEFVG